MAHRRPPEMLFDIESDPQEVKNLAGDPAYAADLRRLRGELHNWQDDIIDLGFMPEAVWVEKFEQRGDLTPRYSLARQQDRLYPLSQLRELADALPDEHATEDFIAGLRSENTAMKFWGAMGLLANHTDTAQTRKILREHLNDQSASIRTIAAQTLATFGETEESLPVLLSVLNDEHPLVALRAANAMDHLGKSATWALPQIKQYLATRAEKQNANALYYDHFPEWVLKRTVERLSNLD